jgi:hypothetical protein
MLAKIRAISPTLIESDALILPPEVTIRTT